MSAAPSSPAPSAATAVDLPADRVGRAHRGALTLVALGALGAEKGGTDALRALSERVGADGRAVDERVRALATGAGIALGDDLGAAEQALVTAVGGRAGAEFDAGWRDAVVDVTRTLRADAVVVRDSAAAEDARATARDVVARVDALAAALDATAAPRAVLAGSGGQAAAPSSGPVALLGLGALLLAVAVRLRRAA